MEKKSDGRESEDSDWPAGRLDAERDYSQNVLIPCVREAGSRVLEVARTKIKMWFKICLPICT